MRALSLFSGGLDSLLAIKIIQNQGIDVIALNFDTGFGSVKDKKKHLEEMLAQIDGKLEIIDIKEEFVKTTLFNPKYGYGKNFNPCIDCHGHMIRVAKSLLQKFDAQFIISGEVLGQRPMSQNKKALGDVCRLSDEGGLLLRPLCAKLLPETLPEREGWVDREKLYDISGRGRSRQIALAKEFGIENFESPAGGCLLTDVNFGLKMKEFVKFDDNFSIDDIPTLKFGRQFRLPDGAKLVIGRDKEDNENIKEIRNPKFEFLYLTEVVGPISIISKDASESDIELASKLILTYSKAESEKTYPIKIGNSENFIHTTKLNSKDEAKEYMIMK